MMMDTQGLMVNVCNLWCDYILSAWRTYGLNHILTLRHLCHCDITKLTLPLHPYCVNSVKQYSDFDSVSVTVLGFMCHNRGRIFIFWVYWVCYCLSNLYMICYSGENQAYARKSHLQVGC